MSDQDNYQRWRELIAANRSDQVLRELQNAAASSPLLNSVVQQRARTRALKERIIKGIISYAEEQQTEDQIRQDLLVLIDAIETGAEADPNLAREMANISITGDVSNAVINSTLHAHEIHLGDRTIVQQAQRKIGHFLTPAPFVPEVFIGREELLRQLDQSLKNPHQPAVTLLHGEGGIGKSSVAAAYCHQFAATYDHIGWLFTETGIESALLRLAPGLNVTFSSEDKDQEAMLDHVLRALANLQGNCLLLLDNVNDRNDLEKHFHRLAGIPNFKVLLTSRLADFPNTHVCPVTPLSESAAAELFAQRYRPLAESESMLFADVFTAVGGNTLVLELLAKNLKRVNALRPAKYLLSDLVADLQQKGILGLRESKAISTQYGGKFQKAEVGAIVTAMYDLEDLPEEELFLLTIFSALPADKIPFAHLELLAGKLEDIEEPLLRLSARGWVEWDEEGGSFRCSPVVQEVVRARRKDWVETIRPVCTVLNEQFVVQAGIHFRDYSLEEITPFANYIASITAHLNAHNDDTLELYRSLGNYYFCAGNFRSAFKAFRERGVLASKLFSVYPEELYWLEMQRTAYSDCGKTAIHLGDREQSIEAYEREVKLIDQLHDREYTDEDSANFAKAIAYFNLGDVYLYATPVDLPAARKIYEDSYDLADNLYRSLPENRQVLEVYAIVHERLGDVNYKAGDYPAALKNFQRQFELFEALFAGQPATATNNHSRALNQEKLGKSRVMTKDLDAATEHFLKMNAFAAAAVALDENSMWSLHILAMSWSQLASVSPLKEDKLAYLHKALDIRTRMVQEWPDFGEGQSSLALVKEDIAMLA